MCLFAPREGGQLPLVQQEPAHKRPSGQSRPHAILMCGVVSLAFLSLDASRSLGAEPVHGDNTRASLNPTTCTGSPVVFPESIFLSSGGLAITWTSVQDVDFIRGPLSRVANYTPLGMGHHPAVMSIDVSADIPTAGSGIFYLVKPAEPCGSWQSTSGAQPQRDLRIHEPCSGVNPTDEQIEDAINTSLAGLPNAWGDTQQFILLFERIQQNLGCTLEFDVSGALLSPESTNCNLTYCSTVHYCGKGNSTTSSFSTAFCASNSLNMVCFTHDRCYDTTCVMSDCYFSPQASSCDNQMFQSSACLAPSNLCDKLVCVLAVKLSQRVQQTPCTLDACASLDDQCHDGECVGDVDPNYPDCYPVAKNNGTPCEDGNSCSYSDTCIFGTCTPGIWDNCPPCGSACN